MTRPSLPPAIPDSAFAGITAPPGGVTRWALYLRSGSTQDAPPGWDDPAFRPEPGHLDLGMRLQLDTLGHLLTARGGVAVEVFADWGPAGQGHARARMLGQAARGTFDRLAVYAPDRLTREQDPTALLEALRPAEGITFAVTGHRLAVPHRSYGFDLDRLDLGPGAGHEDGPAPTEASGP